MKKAIIVIDIILITLFLCAGFVMIKDGDAVGYLELLLGFGLIALTIWFPIWLKNKNKELEASIREARLKAEAKEAEIRELNRRVKAGEWEFPAEKFYLLCRDNKLMSLDNEFSVLKATKMAEQAIKESSPEIDLVNCGEYLKKERLETFLKEGEILAKETEAKELLIRKQVKNAVPTESEQTFISRAKALYPLSGYEKRLMMLDNLYRDYALKIDDLIKGEEALKTLGMIYMDQQKKESSWAIMGGIAEGIAGPAAGFAAAANTMANNEKIREYNASVRKTAMDIMSGVPSLSGNRYALEKEQEAILNKIQETMKKVVLSRPTADDIWQNMKIGNANIKKNASGVLAVSVPVKFNDILKLDVPDGVQMVVDGTLKGEVRFENKAVGDVFIPLPLYGIPSNMTAEIILDGMCGCSVGFDDGYTIKLADKQNLWIMEA